MKVLEAREWTGFEEKETRSLRTKMDICFVEKRYTQYAHIQGFFFSLSAFGRARM